MGLIKKLFMKRLFRIFSMAALLAVFSMSFVIYDYLCVNLPSTPYDYAAIPFPSDIVNNITEMDNTPADNPITDAGATLGRVLFYDVDLSQNHTIACASCHIQEFSFSDTARFSVGFDGGLTRRNSMGLIHARFQKDSFFFWDNRAHSLEIQTLMPFQSPVEMGMTLQGIIDRVSAKPFYAGLFQSAFGTTTVSADRISKALAQFIRSMNTFGSKYRQGVELSTGNPSIVPFPNFTAEENLGKDLFMDITRGNCQACHTRNIMVQQGSKNIGLDLVYADNGVGEATGNHNKDGQFSVPSLINIELTAPYMHDGRYKTLEEVIDFYSDSIKAHPNLDGFLREIIPGNPNPNNNTCDTCPPRRPHYSAQEKAALLAFLKTLTDTSITTDPRWSNPFCKTVVLPVIYGEPFYARPLLSQNEIVWTTVTEINAATFDVERSVDGSRFVVIKRAAASGNSSLRHQYQALDSLPTAGINYYRIRLTEFDGKQHLSKILAVNNKQLQVSVYPNPVQDVIKIQSNATLQHITIVDAAGKNLLKLEGNIRSIPVQSLNAGIYLLKIQMTDGSFVCRQFVIRKH